jgi:hypothetical protein
MLLAEDSRASRLDAFPEGRHLRHLLNPGQEIFMQFPAKAAKSLLPPPQLPPPGRSREFIAKYPTTGVLPGRSHRLDIRQGQTQAEDVHLPAEGTCRSQLEQVSQAEVLQRGTRWPPPAIGSLSLLQQAEPL